MVRIFAFIIKHLELIFEIIAITTSFDTMMSVYLLDPSPSEQEFVLETLIKVIWVRLDIDLYLAIPAPAVLRKTHLCRRSAHKQHLPKAM